MERADIVDVRDQAEKILRKERVSEIARRLGVSPQRISAIKHGREKLTKQMAVRIIRAYLRPPEKSVVHRMDAEELIRRLCREEDISGLEAAARVAISRVVREELLPALREALADWVREAKKEIWGDVD
ncbi:MAG: hypothetical protein HPY71_13630 [Firmicutes bacterium]|nr:hypothetical protein [Bacillota bacterium]